MKATANVEREIRDVLDGWASAYEDMDAGAYVGLFSQDDDVIVFGTGEDEVRVGAYQIAEQARRDFEQADRLAVRLGDVRVSSAGDVAWATMNRAVVGVTVTGQERSIQARITIVFQKQGERWLIQHAHISTPMAGQETGESFPAP